MYVLTLHKEVTSKLLVQSAHTDSCILDVFIYLKTKSRLFDKQSLSLHFPRVLPGAQFLSAASFVHFYEFNPSCK